MVDVPNAYWLPSEDDIVKIHAARLHEGELKGIRDRNLLASAVARPYNLLAYEGPQPVWKLACEICFGLVKNHPFHDGNKRVAFTTLVVVLGLNGFDFTEDMDNDRVVEMMEGVASSAGEKGYLTQSEFEDLVASAVIPKAP